MKRILPFGILLMSVALSFSQGAGEALDFDGNGDYIITDANYTYSAGNDITIEMWFKHESTGTECLWWMNTTHYCRTNGSSGNIRFQWGSSNYQINGVIPFNEWHHYAVRVDGSANTFEMFLDGESIGSASRTETSVTDQIYFGRDASSTGRDWDGNVDEIRLWSEYRSEAEIRENMCKRLLGSESNLELYYRLDEGAGTNISDATSNGRDATKTADGAWEESGASIGDNSDYVYLADAVSWAGDALDCDGTNDYVSNGSSAILRPTTALTVEAWLYFHAAGSWEAPLTYLQDNGSSESGYGLTFNASTGDFMFWVQTVGNSTNNYGNYPAFTPSLNTWYHVAGTYDGSELKIYVNGVPTDSVSRTGDIDWSPLPLDFRLGVYYDNNENNYFDGVIDEVRVWNVARTQSQINDAMCEEISASESGLIAYWRLNEGSGTTAADSSSNSFHGTLTNFSGSGSTSNWVTSTVVCVSDITLYLESSENDSMSVSNISGSPTAVHLYNVQDFPNDTTGAIGVGSNNNYYGVFKVGDNSATYSATYYYRENDGFQTGGTDESDLALYIRDDNADLTWSSVTTTANTTTKTLAATAQSTEFILGSVGVPLPVTWVDFSAELVEQVVKLNWITHSEINNDYFLIEKSLDLRSWTKVDSVAGNANSNERNKYSTVDYELLKGTYYYRLKQVDYDGKFSYSSIEAVSYHPEEELFIFPNPVLQNFTISSSENDFIRSVALYSLNGQLIREVNNLNSENIVVDMSEFKPELYIIKVVTERDIYISKVLKE